MAEDKCIRCGRNLGVTGKYDHIVFVQFPAHTYIVCKDCAMNLRDWIWKEHQENSK